MKTSVIAAAALVLSLPLEARAEQFVLIDATFDYTWDDAINAKPDKSHYYVNEGNFLNKNRPTNWLAPVDYRNGTLHVRAEVFKKPAGDQTTGWTLCYIANVGEYGCADTDYYRSTGIFERETKMTAFWQNDKIQWDRGIKQVDLIYAINDSGSGHITNYPALKDLTTPTRVRITMVQVSAGATYDPSIIDTLNGDAGRSDAGDASWGSWEAGIDASGGAGGSGGLGTGSATGGMGGLLGVGGMGGASTTTTTATATTTTTTTTTATTTGDSTTSSGHAPQGADSENGCAIATRPTRGHALFAAAIASALLGSARRRRTRA